MVIPYHEELEKENRTFHLKIKDHDKQKSLLDEGRRIHDKDIYIPILSSYLSTDGVLIDCTTSHKNNNMLYQYYQGIELLKSNDDIKRSDNKRLKIINEKYFNQELEKLKLYRVCSDSRSIMNKYCLTDRNILIPKEVKEKIENKKNKLKKIDAYIQRRNELRREIKRLEEGKEINSSDIYYYFGGGQSLRFDSLLIDGKYNLKTDYDESIRKNIIGLLYGYIDLMNTFIKLETYAKNNALDFLKDIDYNDFLVKLVGLDKIENKCFKTITTSRLNINESFFNYKIMNWDIRQIPKYVINKETKKIQLLEQSNYISINSTGKEREYEEEIELIKKKVPYEERYKYLIK